MKTKAMAIIMAAVITLSLTSYAANEPSEWASGKISEAYPKLYGAAGIELDYQSPIERAEFSMLVVDAFRAINSGIFPQMGAENVFIDVGERTEDMFVIMLYGLGIVNGVSGTEFAPRRALTRQEMATILVRAKIRQNPDKITEIKNSAGCLDGFSDAAMIAPWAKESFEYAYKSGIITATDGKLSPLDPVTTEEAMVACTSFQTK